MVRSGNRERGDEFCEKKKEDAKSELESIDSILKRWLRVNRVSKRLDKDAIYEKWSEVVGEEIASHTRVVDLMSGILVVEVNSAPLLQELSTYYCEEVLESLKEIEDFRLITNIRFRAGSF